MYTITDTDFHILRDAYSKTDAPTQSLLINMTIWQDADLASSEVKIGNVIIQNDTLAFIYENNLHIFHAVTRDAKEDDMIYIHSSGGAIGSEYIGKAYTIHKAGFLQGFDTYSVESEPTPWYLPIDKSTYYVLENF